MASPDNPAEKVDAFILPRVDTMRSRYITPMADGSRITDADSFHVDVIADVLIHAAIRVDRDPYLVDEDEMLTAIMDLAYRHARDELAEYRAESDRRAEEEADLYDSEQRRNMGRNG